MPKRLAVPVLAALVLTVGGPLTATAPSASAASRVAGPLRTSGNRIIDAAGAPIRLRGVVAGWLASQAAIPATPETPLDPHNIAVMPTWGATQSGAGGVNVVRVLLGEQFWLPDQCQFSPGYQATVQSVVDQITREGMVAVLVLYSNTRVPCAGAAGPQDTADPDALAFWTSVATLFAGNPLVGFELYNEPHLYNDVASPVEAQGADYTTGDDWDVWLNGGVTVDGGVPAPVVGMQQMYDAVRATGARNLVLVDGGSWAEDPPPTDHLLQGTNIVYAEHVYNCIKAPCPAGGDSLPASVNAWPALYSSQPTMITEFGYPSPTDATFNQNVVSWAESHGIGWTAYAWEKGFAGGFGYLQDLAGDVPTISGTPIQQGVALNP